MGKIFYVMGKSASGKDTIYKRIREELPELKIVVPYTTRPIREGERNGVEYHFTTEEDLKRRMAAGQVIEMRTYQTVFGPWSYATVQDGQIALEKNSYLLIGTLESYQNTRAYFGADAMVPLYIEVEDGERLSRAIARERQQKKPNFEEVCRRFLADAADFSEEKLEEAGIEKRFENRDFSECIRVLLDEIAHYALN
ncbi:MAG: guanylate kinase [Clostridium sp.]|nr:guanylate kinase [Clostridium sp.]